MSADDEKPLIDDSDDERLLECVMPTSPKAPVDASSESEGLELGDSEEMAMKQFLERSSSSDSDVEGDGDSTTAVKSNASRLRDLMDLEGDSKHKKKRKLKKMAESDRPQKKARFDDAPVEKAAGFSADNLFSQDDFNDSAESGSDVNKAAPFQYAQSNDEAAPENAGGVPDSEKQPRKWSARNVNKWPLITGRICKLNARCVFASDTGLWSPFKWTNATNDEQFVNPRAIVWGVFCPHAHTPPSSGRARAKDASEDADVLLDDEVPLDGEDDDLAAAGDGTRFGGPTEAHADEDADQQPWFVVVGPPQLVESITSPVFLSEIQLVSVDRERVHFSLNRRATIWYVYRVVAKSLLWPETMHNEWTLAHLKRVLCDTLYAHVFLKPAQQESAELAQVLGGIDGFPLHRSEPHLKMLPPSKVPLNSYSTRQMRLAALNETFKLVTVIPVGQAAVRGVPVVDTSELKRTLIANRSFGRYLFADLEKPAHVWRVLLSEQSLPADAISAFTSWRMSAREVREQFQSIVATLSQRDNPENLLKTVATTLQLRPSWFADWFDSADGARGISPDVRYDYYAVFCASELYFHCLSLHRDYGTVVVPFPDYKFAKQWASAGWFRCSESRRLGHRMANDEDTAPIVEPLPARFEAEAGHVDTFAAQSDLVERVAHMLQLLSKHQQQQQQQKQGSKQQHAITASDRPVFLAENEGSGKRFLVSARLEQRCTVLKRFLLEVILRWCHLRKNKLLRGGFEHLPPLLVQSAAVYGPSTAHLLNDFCEDINSAVASIGDKKLTVFRVKPDARPNDVYSELQQRASEVYVIIFDRFHLWNEELSDRVLNTLTSSSVKTSCAHIVITAHAHTLVHRPAMGSFLNDLSDLANALTRRLLPGDDGVDVGAKFSFSRSKRRLEPGARTAEIYPEERRLAQLQANLVDAVVPSLTVGEIDKIVGQIIDRRVAQKMINPPILIVHARDKTRATIEGSLSSIDGVSRTGTVQFVSYAQFSRGPGNVAGQREVIVACDLDYDGPGRPTCHHINAIFERLTGGAKLYVWSSTGLVKQAAVAQSALRNVFLANSAKTDLIEDEAARFNVLQSMVLKNLDNPKVAPLLEL